MSAKYVIAQGVFDRWVIRNPIDPSLAWSGMRWVSVNGPVQICNFGSKEDAEEYAKEVLDVARRDR